MLSRPLGFMTTLALALLWVLLAIVSPPSGASAPLLIATTAGVPEHRTALVIGNAAYQDAPRRTAVHDARAMAAALRELGFKVSERHDATRQHMDEAITDFTHQLGSEGVAVFYFSGQGVQVHGADYILPVDSRARREGDLAHQAIRIDGLLDRIGEVSNRLNFIILDASRHNPFSHSGRTGRLPQAMIPRQSGTLIAYATAPGMVAEDGAERNSTYTKHLLHFLNMPNLTVEQLFREVRMAVARETGGRQIPWVSTSIRSEFSFAGR